MKFELPPEIKGTRLYFAYGSNMSAKQVHERGLKMSVVGVGRLLNYKLMFNKISTKDSSVGFANIIPHWGSVVYGIVYDMTNLTKENKAISNRSMSEQGKILEVMQNNLRILDKFEGYPSNYQRTDVGVLVEIDNGFLKEEKNLHAFTYIAGLEKQAQTNLFINESYIDKITEGLDSNEINEDYKTEVKELMNIWKMS